jgi:superfamily II DNA or RNA helicase
VRGAWRIHVDDRASDHYIPVGDEVIRDHLQGRHIIGAYPLLPDETCWFLAADFDKAHWEEDVIAVLHACDELAIPASLERSRSGRGGHIWIFFEEPVPASQARKLGCALITRAMERRHQLGLDSYDRLFPNQDTMPRGGFGNLIALPLQRGARGTHNTEFLDRDLRPYPDQWAYLTSVLRVKQRQLDATVEVASRADGIIGVRLSAADGTDDDPWTRPPSRRKAEPRITDPMPGSVQIVQSNLVYIEKDGLPPALLNRLARLAAFQNPEFYKAQAMRLSTFDKPRVISCGENLPRHLALPRGCLGDVVGLLENHAIWVKLVDERQPGTPLDVRFSGKLTPAQETAAEAVLGHEIGVLSAPTAFGKTVIAARLIAHRRVNTLVVVHRQHLLDQWRERLAAFLDLPIKEIGQFGAGKKRPTGRLDVALIQSLQRKGEVNDLVAAYGQVIVDECHHISAFSFERVLRDVKARFVVGLTATPVRKDGHHPVVIMQCGPIRHRVSARAEAAARPFEHVVIPRPTEFNISAEAEAAGIQRIYADLVTDGRRNDLLCNDILSALAEGRSPLVLTERTAHLALLAERLQPSVPHLVVMRGGMGAKQRRATLDTLAAVPPDERRLLLATGRYIGEGFDDARLDTLFLTMPVSWQGTIQQYAGRIHRLYATKKVVRIYDYVDSAVPVLARMYQRRLKGYTAIGYVVSGPETSIA